MESCMVSVYLPVNLWMVTLSNKDQMKNGLSLEMSQSGTGLVFANINFGAVEFYSNTFYQTLTSDFHVLKIIVQWK